MQGSESNKGKKRVLRVLIAHGASTVRQQMKGAVEELGYVQVVGEVANGSEALQQTIEHRPDVVVLAEDAPDLRAGRLTRRIKARQPKAKILIPMDGGLTRDEALAAGVDGFFELSEGYRGLCDILHKLYARMQYPALSPNVKPPPPMPWTNRKLWVGIGVGVGLALLASMIIFPHVAIPLIALSCGLLFFLYGLKYYLSVALILFATSGGSNGNGNGLNGIFNGLGAINGIKKRPETQGQGSLRGVFDRVLQFRFRGVHSDVREEDRKGLKGSNGIANGNGYRFKPNEQPFVSIHLPLYNESRVVGRLLEACTRLDYKNYEVLVADDSTDKTIKDLEKWAKHPKVKVSHRINRTGFKGAALKHAMEVMDPRTQYIVIFDADFIPPPDVLHQFLSYFYGVNGDNGYDPAVGGELNLIDESLAVVQGYQWHILNASENWITRGVRAEFSGSYVVERPGQELTGGMKMISGSVFMIRADLLREVGWGTSITEDWELTIRLYLDGYRVLYSPFIQAPAECVSDFKQLVRQRMRWAEGHTFNVKRYFFPVLSSPKLNRREKLEFIYYVPYYLQSVFFIVGTLAWLIEEIILRTRLPFWTATLGWSLVFTNTFALILMNVAGLFLERGVRRNAAGLMSFIMLTFLLVPYQAYAAMKGLLEPHEGGWHRTDKTGVITEVIDKLGLGRRMRGLMPKRKPRSIDIGKRLGMPAARIVERLPKPLRRLTTRPGLAARVTTGMLLFLLLLSLFSSQIPFVSAAPDVFYLRDTTTNGASPAGEDMNLVQGSSEDTHVFDSVDDDVYWYTDVTYPTGGDNATLAEGNYTLNMHFNQLPSDWWDTDYRYRQPITITAGSDDVPAGYSVNLEFNHQTLVTNGKSLLSGWDLRIVYWNGSGWTELDRVRDDLHPYNQIDTQLWFSTQTGISASTSDTNYYLYYGNSSAGAPPGNWANVFLFYDNFNDSSLDSGRWSCTRGTCSEVTGGLTLSANSSVWANAAYAIGADTHWESRLRLEGDGAEAYFNYWGASDADGYAGQGANDWITFWTDASDHNVANADESSETSSTITVGTPTIAHRYIFLREGTSNVRYFQDANQVENLTTDVPDGNLRAFVWNDSGVDSIRLDYVRVRKYVSDEPTAGVSAEQDAPYVKVAVSVYHTKGDGTDPQEIITSTSITIDANVSDPYALPIGSGGEQTFTSADPRRLRVHIDVTEVNGSGSFTLAYDSATNPSSLETPEMVVPGVTLLLLLVVVFIPITTGLLTKKRWLSFGLAVAMLVLAVFATRTSIVEAAIEETTNIFYFYDDTTPHQYMMYQTQPSGTEQSASNATVNFYSDTFPADWQINGGTNNVNIMMQVDALAASVTVTIYAGTEGDWTQLGTNTQIVIQSPKQMQNFTLSTSGHTFADGEYLWLTVDVPLGTTAYWDGVSNNARLVTPTIVMIEWNLLLILIVPLIPILTTILTRKRRLAARILSVGLSFIVVLTLLATQIIPVSANPDSIYLHDTDAEAPWYSLDWSYRKRITIYASKVSDDLSYFPVLINLSSDAQLAASAQSDGGDILFTSVNGTTKLDHEIERYITGTGELVAWVEVPILSGSIDTVLYMYYGNAIVEDQWNVSGTWNSSYRAVWHLKEDPTASPPQFLDSTTNPNDGTAQPVGLEPTQTGAKIDGGLQFDDSNERHVTVADHTSLNLATNMTVSAWVKTSDVEPDVGLIVNKWGSAVADRNYWLGKFDGSSIAFYVDETQNVTANLSLINDGEWHQVVGVADVANSLLRIYVDDSQVNTAAYDGTSVTGTSDLHIGSGAGEVQQEFDGVIDEVRVASEAFTADWIITSFDNQDNPAAFYELGNQETPGMSPTGKEMSTTLGSGAATLQFDSVDDESYWYSDFAFPEGDEDGSIAAGPYSLKMYFSQLPQVPSDWYNSAWIYRKPITIYGSQVAAGGVSNLPVLIDLPSDTELAANACNAPSAGYDILFTSSNGTSKLSHEIESFDDSTGALTAWVKVPTLTNPADTTIYMYYGNSACADQQDVANVWTSYEGVWHFTESSGTGYYVQNSRQDDYHADEGSTLYLSSSIIGGGRDFNNSRLDVQNGTDLLDGDTSFTLEFWGYPDYATDAIWVAASEDEFLESDSLTLCRWKSSGTGTGWIQCDVKWSDSSTSYPNCTDCLNRAQWNHIVLTYDGTYLRWYINGSQSASNTVSGKSLRTNSLLHFGTDQYLIDSNFDEFRYARSFVGAGWIETEYNNQSDPANFSGLGSEETLPSVEIAVSVYHSDADGSNEQLIVENLSTLIDTSTINGYELAIGTDGTGQTFPAGAPPQRLRLHIDVVAVNGGGSFTLAYDSAVDPSALNTPGITIPEWGGAFLVLMPLIPYLMTLIWRRKRRIGNFISILLVGCVAMGLLATNVPSASAAPTLDVNNSTTFWWYDDTTPFTYMMYQTQPTGSSTSATNTTVSFYSDTWPAGYQVSSGTSTVYFTVDTTGVRSVNFTLLAGTTGSWTTLGTGSWNGNQSMTLVSTSFSTNGYTFSTGERLRLDVSPAWKATVYWDGSYNTSRLVVPTIIVAEGAIGLVAVVVAIPLVMGAMQRRRRARALLSAVSKGGSDG